MALKVRLELIFIMVPWVNPRRPKMFGTHTWYREEGWS